jgi:hypothetical protein
LTTTRDRAREQEVRDVGARDQEHETADAQQDLQTLSVLFFHDADAGPGRYDRDCLLRQHANDIRHPVGGITRVVFHPLAQHRRQPRCHPVDRGSRPQPADRSEPRRDRLTQQRAVADNQRLLLERNPEVRRIAAERLAEEPGRRDTDDGERVPLDDERRADDRGIAAVRALPGVMADDHRRCRRRFVVVGCEDAASEGADAERRKIVAGDVLRAQGPGRRV